MQSWCAVEVGGEGGAGVVTHSKTAVMAWGAEEPVFSIGWDEPLGPTDSGFTILFSDAPPPEEVEPDDPRVSVICLSCLLDDHPELGAALDLARRYGAAELDLDGRWIAAPFDD